MSALTIAVELPAKPRSVTAARHIALELLAAWEAPHNAEDVALLITELVTNVVDHVGGDSALILELSLTEDRLHVGVVDGSSVRPVARELDQDNPRGRGVRIVQAIADRWGSDDHHGGKRVWFELSP